tara:strand:- start:37 stop:516 length:480 start_codon:yes stop_codon:yes gene_type:complete
MKKYFPYMALLLVIVIADQVSKILLDTYLEYGKAFNIMPGIDFLLVYNPGAAFGILSDQPGWQRWFLILVSIFISAILVFWIKRTAETSKIESFSITFILAGAIGNLLDRLMYGYVIDFIHLFWGDISWPNFNIADSSITIGAILFIYIQVFCKKELQN